VKNNEFEELKHYPISMREVVRARATVGKYLKPTQLLRYEGLSRLIGANVYVKHENHNPTGTFKVRGGLNLMSHLKEKGVEGVITFSTGNHGISIAMAARWFGMGAVVVVPENNNPVKNRAIIEAGAELVESGATFEEASETVDRLCEERSLYFVHPADEPHLINGVGTEFLEVIDDLPDIDVMIVPLGAGSEAAAAITTLHAFRPDIRVVAVQAAASPAACNSWRSRKSSSAPNTTFAGGFATGKVYEVPFEIYRDGLHDFVLVTEDEIYEAIGMALHHTRNLAEGAGAASIMAAYKVRDALKGRNVVLQMSGCNASPEEITEATNRRGFSSGEPA
jgi:threonine dehydratase